MSTNPDDSRNLTDTIVVKGAHSGRESPAPDFITGTNSRPSYQTKISTITLRSKIRLLFSFFVIYSIIHTFGLLNNQDENGKRILHAARVRGHSAALGKELLPESE